MATPPPPEREERASTRLMTARVRRTPARFSVTLTALAILFVVVYAFVLKPAPSVTAPALSSASGRFVSIEEQREGGEVKRTSATGTFVLSGDGSAAVDVVVENGGLSFDRPGPGRYVYDAERRESLHVTETRAGGERAELVTGGWPPLWHVGAYTPLEYQDDAAIVRSAVEDGDETIGIKPVLYEERKAWRASWRSGSWQKDLVVDQETGLVLWYSLRSAGDGDAGGVEYRVEGLRLDEPPAAGAFDTTPPAGARLESFESGDPAFVGGLEEAAERIGVALPASTLDPDGYDVAAVATTASPGVPASWIDLKAAGPSMGARHDDALLLVYAKGLSSYTIEIVATQDRTALGGWSWEDLFGHATVELQYGLFAGRTAHTWYGQGPTAVVWDDDYVVRVSGGLTRTEAVSILEGLEL